MQISYNGTIKYCVQKWNPGIDIYIQAQEMKFIICLGHTYENLLLRPDQPNYELKSQKENCVLIGPRWP